MVRNRLVAAILATLPLAACEMADPDTTAPGTEKTEQLSVGDVQSALAALPGARIVGAHDNGIPYMIDGRLGTASGSVNGLTALGAHDRISQVLPGIAAAFRVGASDLVVSRTFTDAQGTHIRYSQMKNGLKVVGEELIVHVDKAGNIFAANGTARDGESVSAKASIAPEAAVSAVLHTTLGRHIEAEGSPSLVYIRSGKDQGLKLAYEQLVVGEGRDLPIRERVYVSAVDGSVLERRSEIHTALSRKVYTANNGTTTPGTLKRSEGGAASGDSIVDGNYTLLGNTYNCYKTLFGRDSFDGAGGTYISTVHYSSNYVNAYWNGTQMVYGDGDGVNSSSLALDEDVTTHELTHAVTERTSNLTYSGESGGLNESMSDSFAAICQSWETAWATTTPIWQIGEKVWTPGTAGDALRYMDDPAKDGGSLDYWTSSAGSVDVHYSSGISNLALALLSKGGTHPRGKSTINVTGIGTQKAGQIWFKANTTLFTPSTTFAQAKTYTEQAATALGYTTADVASVTAAWQAVGVGVTVVITGTPLTNGVAKTGLSGAASASAYYYLDVPASKAVSFVMSGGTGDADMYVKFGTQASTTTYDCRPYLTGNAETCSMAAKTTAGRYSVMLRGYSAYSGVSLKGTY